MLRVAAGVGSALLLLVAGFFAWKGVAQDEEGPVPPAPEARATGPSDSGPPPRPPAADERTKEQRRYDRADRDKDGRIILDELYHPRRRAFQRLDRNGDGRLVFEEWAASTAEKFAEADADRDRSLSRTEFATTAPRRRTPARKQNCRC